MKVYLLIALGSGLGGMARHWIATLFTARDLSPFPWATFLVNLVGSFLIGWVASLPEGRLPAIDGILPRYFLTIGFLGGFTTFSSFSIQTVALFQAGKISFAAAYILASVILCIAGAWAGWALAVK